MLTSVTTMLTSITTKLQSKPGPGPVPLGEDEARTEVEAVARPGEGDTTASWVEPLETDCPASHPVKAKLASGLFHEPGMSVYARTRPDRCYLDPASAEADGLTRAKR